MAVVVRDSRNRSPFWYACFTTADGRRLKKSTKETNLAKAKIIAETLQRAENMAAERTLTAVRTRDLLNDVLQRVSGEALRVFTAKEWFDHFAKQKRKSKSEKTALRHEQMHDESGLLAKLETSSRGTKRSAAKNNAGIIIASSKCPILGMKCGIKSNGIYK